MKHDHPLILSLNGGSSSIRFALYSLETTLILQMHGKIDRIGLDKPAFSYVSEKSVRHDLPCDSVTNFSTAIHGDLEVVGGGVCPETCAHGFCKAGNVQRRSGGGPFGQQRRN